LGVSYLGASYLGVSYSAAWYESAAANATKATRIIKNWNIILKIKLILAIEIFNL
jgi:hypothetical protein